jgi:hypothetical protein
MNSFLARRVALLGALIYVFFLALVCARAEVPPLTPPASITDRPVNLQPGLAAAALAGPMKGVQEIVFASCGPKGRGTPWYSTYGFAIAGKSGGPTTVEEVAKGRDKVLGAFQTAADCRLTKLNLRTRAITVLVDEPKGGIRDPFVDYDGQRILFSRQEGGTNRWRLWEIKADGSGLRQLTNDDEDDIEPVALPNGEIIFSSTRQHRMVPCGWTQIATLHRCDRDGRNIRPISAGIEVNRHPWPLPDGKIVFTRWEYTHRFVNAFINLFSVEPDGTSQQVLFGNQADPRYPWIQNGHFPEAKPIPGTTKLVASYCPEHHSNDGEGFICTIDLSKGPDDWSALRLFADYDESVTYPGPAEADNHERFRRLLQADSHMRGRFRDPYPFSEDCFLVCRQDQIMVMNGKGACEAIHAAGKGVTVNEPRPIVARPAPPVMPERVDYTKTTGTFLLMDAYHGRDMATVKPGDIAKLLVLEETPRPVAGDDTCPGGVNMNSQNPLRILGTVPVEPDGSAHFEVPAGRSIVFALLDKKDKSIKMMRSWVGVMPGEQASCVGCHEYRKEAAAPLPPRQAFGRPASVIQPIVGVPAIIDFHRDIQPILDRACVSCHSPQKPEGRLSLVEHAGLSFTHGYSELTQRFFAPSGAYGMGRDLPYAEGSATAPLLQLLERGHYDVKLDGNDRNRLRLWIDTGHFYSGVYASLRNGRLFYAMDKLMDKETEVLARRCDQCHVQGKRAGTSPWPRNGNDDYAADRTARDAFWDLTAPEQSLLLRAPLAKEAGGLAWCRQADARSKTGKPSDPAAAPVSVFADTKDPDYQRLLVKITEMADWLKRNPRFYQPGFKPSPEYVFMMQMYGVLPRDFQAGTTPVDPYALEERYYQSFWLPGQRTVTPVAGQKP